MAIKKKMAGDKEGEGASKKAMTEEKMRGMAKRIRDAVESGELSAEEAKKKMMELRKMMAGDKMDEKKSKKELSIEDFEGIEKRLRAAVESGELSEEEAKRKMMAIKKKMAGDEAGEKEEGVYGSFKRMGIDEKRVGRLKGALLEAGIKGERVEGSLGMILRMASQMKAKGDSYKMNGRILGYLKNDLELSMAQIGLIKGLAARLAKGMEKD